MRRVAVLVLLAGCAAQPVPTQVADPPAAETTDTGGAASGGSETPTPGSAADAMSEQQPEVVSVSADGDVVVAGVPLRLRVTACTNHGEVVEAGGQSLQDAAVLIDAANDGDTELWVTVRGFIDTPVMEAYAEGVAVLAPGETTTIRVRPTSFRPIPAPIGGCRVEGVAVQAARSTLDLTPRLDPLVDGDVTDQVVHPPSTAVASLESLTVEARFGDGELPADRCVEANGLHGFRQEPFATDGRVRVFIDPASCDAALHGDS